MRIVKEIEIEGKKARVLFDTGSFHTYVTRRLLDGIHIRQVPVPYKVAIGGEAIEVKESCIIVGRIEGYGFDTKATPINELGEVDGKVLDAIIGAETMEGWEIKLDPRNDTLDLDGLKRREFTEY